MMKKIAADRMLRAELPEYKEVGLLSQADSEARIRKVKHEVGGFISLAVADSQVNFRNA